MINIIIAKQQLLFELDNDKMLLPSDKTLKNISHLLSPIVSTQDKFVASINTEDFNPPLTLKLVGLRQAFSHLTQEVFLDVLYYQQLHEYYSTHRYCGRCGNQTIRLFANKFVKCEFCDCEIYPHIAPCVIVRIHKEDSILMARGVNFPPNVWGLIAGFVEIGETLEEAIRREVLEEVGVEIDNIKYWGSQPWPMPSNSLMVAYTADYKSGEIVRQESEIAEAGFYTHDNLPGKPSSHYSIASRMIDEYIQAKLKLSV